MPRDDKARSEDNTTLTISLSKILKKRIEEAASKDHRKTSPWCVLRLTEILDALEASPAKSSPKLVRDKLGKLKQNGKTGTNGQ